MVDFRHSEASRAAAAVAAVEAAVVSEHALPKRWERNFNLLCNCEAKVNILCTCLLNTSTWTKAFDWFKLRAFSPAVQAWITTGCTMVRYSVHTLIDIAFDNFTSIFSLCCNNKQPQNHYCKSHPHDVQNAWHPLIAMSDQSLRLDHEQMWTTSRSSLIRRAIDLAARKSPVDHHLLGYRATEQVRCQLVCMAKARIHCMCVGNRRQMWNSFSRLTVL